ncbi:MAG: hypothetical protein UU58_C0001G0012 [Candidatus Nomurabacteria bacterium GW2011_GWA2_41_25]|uniref:Uncharacterized protein n=1 Tax=Candidatus Nomurabacteria bacterium GW2011_GWA2_41_25 TaxID=1618736 RepID=A0A0G0VZN3_9BACT|nr:MAG: hypothetical protein UU58_C0001G0012 [Candidatus Nomurabacteria bacterium GW2011_GWA2_41_25]OGI66946.1 MAG: hypothetical protein A2823_02490 [Candidatus Nomurabacteria bacterium RIFCSPHIGHO2_01_FULL_41_91]OGI80425.1 MAG: hypothetical protein A3D43_00110 [Candidatus Nomurabacteria bacterium RIFCSPHIGHO2_02_FULL_41_52]OGI94050.1 MAG: hypothetical protein A3A07_01915 [Candidatus Nomurabacteria bacterium RIFCSPLOWO2_01_FULL_41_52]
MNQNYKPYISSPYQIQKKVNVQEKKSPIQEEVEKNIGTFNLTVQVAEDKNTISEFPHIENFIAFIATIKKGSEILGIGRGSAVLNRLNKWVSRGVRYAYCQSITDAIIRSVKTLDALYIQTTEPKDSSISVGEIEYATDKQKSYLRELINANVIDESKRKYWESQVNQLTKEEASQKIQTFVENNY